MQANKNMNLRNITEEETRNFLATLNKERLIDMIVDMLKNEKQDKEEQLKIPIQPFPFSSEGYYNCSDWAHCSNPHRDCFNCPLRYSGSGGTWTTSTGTIVSNNEPMKSNFD